MLWLMTACKLLAASELEQSSVERVFLRGGGLLQVKGGLTLPVTNQLSLSHGIKVMTNATFRVQEGKERRLLEGQVLGGDGMLTSPDGTLRPAFDHVAFVKGQSLLVKDGEAAPLSADKELGDGRRVTTDGFLISKSSARRKLLDGETFDLAGTTVPASDTIAFREGKVFVQKDGSSMEVPSGRSMMMNDGTKVFGSGMVVFKDGTSKNLSPGEILKLEGVLPRNP